MKNVEDRWGRRGLCFQDQVHCLCAEYPLRFGAEKRMSHACACLPLPETMECDYEEAQSTECPGQQRRCGHSIVHVRCFGGPAKVLVVALQTLH